MQFSIMIITSTKLPQCNFQFYGQTVTYVEKITLWQLIFYQLIIVMSCGYSSASERIKKWMLTSWIIIRHQMVNDTEMRSAMICDRSIW